MTYVVLAAGTARRMGFAKVFTPLRGTPPLSRLAALLQGREAIAVVPPERAGEARAMAPAMRVVVNAQPERGMAHSLRLAVAMLDGDFGVLLGDKPFLRAQTLHVLERALDGADVVYPVRADGVPGHPVLFASHLRERALALPDGDTIVRLRDDPSLRRTRLEIHDGGAFDDLDEPAQWSAADA